MMQHVSSKKTVFWALSALMLCAPALVVAQPASLSVQGRLLSKAGPAPDGDYGITLLFYEKKGDEKALFSHVDAGVKVQGGAFSISMGDTSKLDTKPWSQGKVHWMGIKIGSEPELPRVPVRSVPYALAAGVASSVACSGCVGQAQIDPVLLASIDGQMKKLATSVAGVSQAADANAKGLKGLSAVAKSGKYSDLSGAPTAAAADQKCGVGSVVTGVDAKGGLVCAKDAGGHDLKVLDARFVNEKQGNSVTAAMVVDGSLKYADTDVNSIQRRVLGKCPAGQSVGEINSNGSVVCVDAGSTGVSAGKTVNGNWYLVAQSKIGTASGILTVSDKTYGAVLRIGVAVTQGDANNATLRLLEHSRNANRLFSTFRLLRGSATKPLLLYARAERNAAVELRIDGGDGVGVWTAANWKQTGTQTPAASGYAAHDLPVDKLAVWAQGDRSVTFNRVGAAQTIASNSTNADSTIYVGGPGGVEVTTAVVPSKGLEKTTNPLRIFAVNKSTKKGATIMQVRHDGAIGLGTTARDSYGLNVANHVHMNDKNINYVNQLHFNHGVHFYDNNDGRYINIKSGQTSHGGLIFRDSEGHVQGHLYFDGNNSNPSFGVLDKQSHWAIQVRHDDYIAFRVNNSTVMTVDNAGVGIMSGARSGYALDLGGHLDMSNKEVNYVTQLHFNDNVRFNDEGNDSYLNFTYGDSNGGGIKVYDGNGTRQGALYSDGNASNPSFGLLDADQNWAVRVRDDDYTALYVNGAEKVKATSDGVKLTGSVRTANGQWQRDIWQYNTTTKGARYLHIKTNIRYSNYMFCFQIRGYNYGRVREINNMWCGYANADNTMKGLRHRQYDDGLYNMTQYRTKDDYVALRVYANNVYYMGLSASAWTLNPAGVGHDTKVLSSSLSTSSSNKW